MKKTYTFLILLLLLLVGSAGVIGSVIYGQRDDVTIRERVLYGDKSVAEGITVVSQNHMNSHLFWKTSYRMGEEPSSETKYTFFAKRNEKEQEHVYSGISLHTSIEYHYPGTGSNPTEIQKEYDKLYRSLKKGEVKSKNVYIKDYYDYYPIQMFIDLPNTVWVNNELGTEVGENPFDPKYVLDKFQMFFKIPVLETDYVKITVSKAEDSPNSHTSYSEERSAEAHFYQVGSVSTYTANVCYFAINNRTTRYDDYNRGPSDGEYVDTSLIPGGYGIYSFSYGRGTGEYHTGIDADSLQMVFSLEQDVKVEHMMIRENQTQLILLTEEDEGAFVRIIDLASMKEVQNIRLDDTLYNRFGRYAYVLEYDDFFAVVYDGNIAVISETKDVYEHVFTVSLEEEKGYYFPDTGYPIAMDFNGEKLAVVGMQGENLGFSNCDYCLIVYDASGLLFHGEYLTGMSQYHCDPVIVDTYCVSW